MKKLLGCLLTVMLLCCLAGPAAALPLDTAIGISCSLHDSSPDTEEAWLSTLLSVDPGDQLGTFNPGTNALLPPDGYDPGFDWDFAVVKQADCWYAFSDVVDVPIGPTNIGRGDNALVYNMSVTSHVDFWGTPVPEPATMLLLGSGLIGLAGFGRKKFKK